MKENEKKMTIEQVRYLLESEPNRNWTLSQIGDIIGYRGSRQYLLRTLLAEMVEDGILDLGKRGVYSLRQSKDLFEGKLEIARSGTGFVNNPKTGRSLRIPAGDIRGALPGDTVLVRPVKIGKDEESGKIVKITARTEKLICGTLSVAGKYAFVIPVDPSYQKDIFIRNPGEAKDGDRVVVKFTGWDNDRENPDGEIVDVIGPADKPSLDTDVICREYELPGNFSPTVMAEATNALSFLDEPGDRLDLRKKYILTIDPATSKDFDDAISFTVNKDGTRELGVHIADVSHFIKEGTEIDREAARRGNSVYLADKVIPMLPEQLSNGVCSLRPHEDRLAFSVFLTFGKGGEVIKRSFAKSVIRSKLRLNYEQAFAIIEGREPEGLKTVTKAAKDILKGASTLALQLRANRMKQGALDLDVPECRVIIDADGRMTGFAVDEYDVSHQMIEECMVAANEAVAAELASHGRAVIARLHEAPDPVKIEDLVVSLRTLGMRPGDITKPNNLAAFIASIADHPLKNQAQTLILRSMKRALYSADDTGHFGLAKHFYSHFTSPIRRYPDLVLHRQLAEFLTGTKRNSYSKNYLQSVAAQSTQTEQRAEEAERTLLEIKKYRYLQQQIDDGKIEVYDAVIAKITSFGIFVDLPLLMIGGLIHISTISDKYVRFNPSDESLSAGSTRYTLGDKIRVHIARVDFNAKRLDFAIAQEPSQQTSNKQQSSRKKRKAK